MHRRKKRENEVNLLPSFLWLKHSALFKCSVQNIFLKNKGFHSDMLPRVPLFSQPFIVRSFFTKQACANHY